MSFEYDSQQEFPAPEKPQPKLRSFYELGSNASGTFVRSLPYEFTTYEVLTVLGELLHHGITEMTVHRHIIDQNAPPAPPVPRVEEDE